MTAELIAGVAAAVLSLLLEVVPGLREWWNGLADAPKRLGWLIACLIVPFVILGAGCAGLYLGVDAPACTKQGAVDALLIAGFAYFGGQASYALVGKEARRKVNGQ